MVTFTITYQGDLRCAAVHGPSKTMLLTDAPLDNHGRGESFSPTDLIATGLATCVLTTIGIVAKRDAVAFTGATAEVAKHMTSDLPRRIARLVVHIAMPLGLAHEVRAKLERAGHTCPVKLSLHPDLVVELAYRYAD